MTSNYKEKFIGNGYIYETDTQGYFRVIRQDGEMYWMRLQEIGNGKIGDIGKIIYVSDTNYGLTKFIPDDTVEIYLNDLVRNFNDKWNANIKIKPTREEVEELKSNWFDDPCWDIYDTEGFEDYKDELMEYQRECERNWKYEIEIEDEKEKQEAEEIGLVGLYRMIKQLKEELRFISEIVNDIPRMR